MVEHFNKFWRFEYWQMINMLNGIYRSKTPIEVYENHNSGRLSDYDFVFFCFEIGGGVARYISSDFNPVGLDHEFWSTCKGHIKDANWDSCNLELYDNMTKRSAFFFVKIINEKCCEITNLKSGITKEYEKVVAF